MRLSNQIKISSGFSYNKDLSTYELIKQIGWFDFSNSGFPFYLPIGKKIIDGVDRLLTTFASNLGFEEVGYPFLIPKNLLRDTEKIEDFISEIYFTKEEDFAVNPTTEEFILYLLNHSQISYKNLPIKWFSNQDVLRNIKRPEGFMKTRQIKCLSMISVSEDKTQYLNERKRFEEGFKELLSRLDIPFIELPFKKNGTEYLYPCEYGEKRIEEGNATSLGMFYIYQNDGIKYVSREGKKRDAVIGTYGIGTQRVLFAVIDCNRDELGINFPPDIRPFEYSIILHEGNSGLAEKCYETLRKEGESVYIDDRSVSFKEKVSYSDLLGVPEKIIIGRNSSQEKLEIKTRKGDVFYKSLEELI